MSEVPEVVDLKKFCRPAENFLTYADLCAAVWLVERLEQNRWGVVKLRMALLAAYLKGRVDDLTEGAVKRRISNLLRWLREQVGEVAPAPVVKSALLEYIYRHLEA
jgi:hypothetical protein